MICTSKLFLNFDSSSLHRLNGAGRGNVVIIQARKQPGCPGKWSHGAGRGKETVGETIAGDKGGVGVPCMSGPSSGSCFHAMCSPQYLRHLLCLTHHLPTVPLSHPLRCPSHPIVIDLEPGYCLC